MKRLAYSLRKAGGAAACLAAACLAALAAGPVWADSLGAAYVSSYSFQTMSVPTGLTRPAGLVIDPNNPNVLLIGGNAATLSGEVYSVGLARDPVTHRITGYSGSPSFYAFAPDIDGGLTIAPDNDLLFTEYSDNAVGELKPGSTTPDRTVGLPSLLASTGGMTFIPAGFGGAGNLAITSYSRSVVCAAAAMPDGSGTYNIESCGSSVTLSGTLEGILYVAAGTGGFATNTVLITTSSGYVGGATVTAYQVDSSGMPVASGASTFFTGSANEGLALDPVTGDILATDYLGSLPVVYDIYSTVHATPEPGSAGLLAVGLLALGCRALLRDHRIDPAGPHDVL